MKDKKVTGSSQHGFMKGKSSPTSLVAFNSNTASSVGEGRAVDGVYHVFSKTFDTDSPNTLMNKLVKYRLDE